MQYQMLEPHHYVNFDKVTLNNLIDSIAALSERKNRNKIIVVINNVRIIKTDISSYTLLEFTVLR